MRRTHLLGTLALIGLATCSPDPGRVAAPDRAHFAHTPDLTGLPDIIVDRANLAASWVIYVQTLSPTQCDVVEGDVPSGTHRLLRFSVTTPNIGSADLALGDPNEHMDPNGDGDFRDSDGLYELATCHRHFHFRHYATYELLPVRADGSLGPSLISAKRGFCMIDVDPANGGIPTKPWVYRSCGRVGIAGNQGIANGWADQYFKWLQGQYFVVDPEVAPPGDYVIRITVNPPFVATKRDVCPHLDPQGFCHMLPESDYSNNIAEVRITIPADRPGKTGWGPGGGSEPPTNAFAFDDEERPTK